MAYDPLVWFAAEIRILRKRLAALEQPATLATPSPTILFLDALISVDAFPLKPPGVWSDFSPHQFIAHDCNAADNSEFIADSKKYEYSDDDEQDFAETKVLPAEVYGAFTDISNNDDAEQYVHGDVETHALDVDTSDFSPHQFIAPDAGNDIARSKIFSAEVFDTEKSPSPDNFIQKRASNDVAKPKILSAKVFDSKDVPSPDNYVPFTRSDDNEQDATNTAAMSKILSAGFFDSVGSDDNEQDAARNAAAKSKIKHMPHEDDGEQYECGDTEIYAIADTADLSPHQFIASDEVRDPVGSDDNEQDAASDDAAGSKILSAEAFDNCDKDPKTLDPLHVNVMIEIAKKMSEETTNACVTTVATKLLKCMNDKMSVFEEKIKVLKEDVAMTRHIQHVTFSRNFGDHY